MLRQIQPKQDAQILKIAILGLGSVGKTTISKKFSGELLNLNDISMTKGVDISIKRIIINNRKVTLQLWDFAGQKQFHFMIPALLRGVKAIIYVYDVTDVETFYALHNFIEMIRNFFIQNKIPRVPEAIIGNKVDLGKSEVSISDISTFMLTYGIKKHFLVSGLMDENITEPFHYIAKAILECEQTDISFDNGLR